MQVKRFNPLKINVLLEAKYLVTGFGSESFVEIKENTPRYKVYTDIDGVNSFTKSKNKSAEIRLTLKDNSSSVAFINECIRAIDNNEIAGISILVMDDNTKQDPKGYYGYECKVNIETTSKGVKLGEKDYIFLPKKYYNEVDLMQPESNDYLEALGYLADSKSKVKA